MVSFFTPEQTRPQAIYRSHGWAPSVQHVPKANLEHLAPPI